MVLSPEQKQSTVTIVLLAGWVYCPPAQQRDHLHRSLVSGVGPEEGLGCWIVIGIPQGGHQLVAQVLLRRVCFCGAEVPRHCILHLGQGPGTLTYVTLWTLYYLCRVSHSFNGSLPSVCKAPGAISKVAAGTDRKSHSRITSHLPLGLVAATSLPEAKRKLLASTPRASLCFF